jgi:hypothetical protein
MTGSYHERNAAAFVRHRTALRFVVIGFALALGGCSVSVPMAGLIDESTNGSISTKTAGAPSRETAVEKTVAEVAASQPAP